MCGSQNIVLQGKTIVMADCIVRGDLAAVKIGKNCVIGEKCVIRPPFKKFAKGVAFFPMQIGDHVFIEDESVINAASIGSFVHIGKNSVIGRRCIIMDCSYILPNSVIPPETVIPSYCELRMKEQVEGERFGLVCFSGLWWITSGIRGRVSRNSERIND